MSEVFHCEGCAAGVDHDYGNCFRARIEASDKVGNALCALVETQRKRIEVLEGALRRILYCNGEYVPMCGVCSDVALAALGGAPALKARGGGR